MDPDNLYKDQAFSFSVLNDILDDGNLPDNNLDDKTSVKINIFELVHLSEMIQGTVNEYSWQEPPIIYQDHEGATNQYIKITGTVGSEVSKINPHIEFINNNPQPLTSDRSSVGTDIYF